MFHVMSFVLGKGERDIPHPHDRRRCLDMRFELRSGLILGVEFDGAHWHAGRERSDYLKSRMFRDEGIVDEMMRARERPLEVIHPELDVLVPVKTTGALSAQLALVHLAHLSILDQHQCNSVIGLIHAASRPLKHTDITCAGCFKFCDYYLPSLEVPPIES